MPGLEDLDLSLNHLSEGGLQYLARLPGLRKLKLDGCELTDDGVAALPPMPHLEEMDLSHNRLTGRGLASLSGCPNLRVLKLDSNPLESEAFWHLVELKRLNDVDVSRTKVTKAVAPFILQMTQVSEITMCQVPITVDEVQDITSQWQSGGMIRHIYREKWEDPLDPANQPKITINIPGFEGFTG